MKKTQLLMAALLACGSMAAQAADLWKPFEVQSIDGAKATNLMMEPLQSASKPWKLCVLFPHMKDSYWLAVDYGVIDEVRRLGLSVTILQAGGYDALPKQVAQFDDCMAAKPDAIIVAPISEAGLRNKFKESMAKGIPTITVINPVVDAPVTSKIFVDFKAKGKASGLVLKDVLGANGGKVVAFPGPQGSGWAESYLAGFQEAIANSKVQVIGTKFGEAGVAEQLRLVEDSLQSYSDMTAIWGGAPAAEAALGALKEAGRTDIKVVSSYENPAMTKAVQAGRIQGFAIEAPVIQARIAVNLAVSAIEKRPVPKHLMVVPQIVTRENVKSMDPTMILAPEKFQPTFSVK